MSEIRDLIRTFVVESFLYGQDDGFGDDDSLLGKGIIDSAGVIELVAHIETCFQLTVLDPEIVPDNLDSIRAICSFVERKRSSMDCAP